MSGVAICSACSRASGTAFFAASVGVERATVGDQIEDRAVRLVPDRADHGVLAARPPLQPSSLNGQQIFQRSAPRAM
jgi:hypothetical protein